MRFQLAFAPLVACVLLTGCATTSVSLRTTNSPVLGGSAPTAGSPYAAAAIQAEMSPNAYFGLFFLGYMMAGIHDSYLRSNDGASSRKPPELAEGRAIAERDCTEPLEQMSANLRCK
ncbi:MAG: hypothetical protein V1796_01490 [Pseudomonadota bacterium]